MASTSNNSDPTVNGHGTGQKSSHEPYIDPILFIIDAKNPNTVSKATLESHIKASIKGKVARFTVEETGKKDKDLSELEKIKVVIYPANLETAEEILSDKCPLLKEGMKRSLAVNQFEVIITNLKLDEINNNMDIKNRLTELGMVRFSLISKNHSSDRFLVRAACINEATQRSLLKNDIEMPVGDRIKTYYVEPPIRAVIQCKKYCEIGHILKNCQKQEICDKCNNLKHGVDSCGPIVQCKNCPENHSSYDRKCNKYRSEKDNMIAAEMLNHGMTSKKGKLYKIKNGSNNQKGKKRVC